MNKSDIIEKMKDIIEHVSGIPKDSIEEDRSLLDDLELSSLEIFMMIGEIENAFSIDISEAEIRNIVTLADLAEIVLKRAC